jgi:uncharacterized protein involved in response to NO
MTLDYYESPLKRKFKAFLTKPHQPFFLLGAFLAFYSVAMLAFMLNGQLSMDIRFFHTFNISVLMPTALFLGFLTTVLYRFLLVMPFLQKDYMRIFWTLASGVIIAQIGFFVWDFILFFGIITVAASQILALKMFIGAYSKSNIDDKQDPFWILAAFCAGAISTLLFAASIFLPQLLSLAINIAFYAFAVAIVFAVAQKMVPNFFSIYFASEQPAKNKYLLPALISSLFAIALLRSFGFDLLLLAINTIGLALGIGLLYKHKNIFTKSPAVLWVLQLGMVWFVCGFAGGVLEGVLKLIYNIDISSLFQVHIWGVGFIATMIIGFGSRVALGHSGRKIAADTLSALIFASLTVLAIVRIVAVFEPSFLSFSAYLWCAIFGVWLYRYTPMLISE